MNMYDAVMKCRDTDVSIKNYRITKLRKFNIVDAFIRFAKHESDLKYWKPLFAIQLIKWGFDKKSAENLFQWGECGWYNWSNMNPSKDEETMSVEELGRSFYGEVSYCSDRMGWDRLFRCHRLFNLYRSRLLDEQSVKG